MYLFEETYYFYFMAAIPLLTVGYLFILLWKKRAQKRFGNKESLRKLSPDKSTFKSTLKLIFLLLALFFLTVALVNPKIGNKTETVKREGVDIVFALDVSKSMLAEDIAPNRLEKSKQLVSQIMNNLGGDRIGIIGYAGSAFPQLPITTDYNSAKMFLNSMNTDMVSSQGTAIQEAIQLAKTYYDNDDQTSKVLILLSDGENHQGNTAAISREAREEGIQIITIGVGTASGGPIPIKKNGILQEYKRDNNGERVITKLSKETLQSIAKEAQGNYLDGKNTATVVEQVQELLNALDKKEFESRQFADFKDQFQWFLGATILLLIIELLMLERKTTWVQKLNLFNEKNDE